MTGSASDWQLRRLPPLCLVCSEPLEVLPGGAQGVSQALLPTPSSATYVRLPAAPRPRPATPELRPEPRAAENEAAAAAAVDSSGGTVIRSRNRREETGLSWWNLLQARARGWSSRERGPGGAPSKG